MRRLALILLCLAVASCGADEDAGCQGLLPTTVEWKGHLYIASDTPPPRPRPGPLLEGGVRRPCGVSHPVALRRVSGAPAEVAVYRDGDTDLIYLDVGFFIELPAHPLHDRFYSGPDRPRRRGRGARCRLDGEVSSVSAYYVEAGGRSVFVAVDARTQVVGFERAGLPYKQVGDRVRIHGRGCDGGVLVARRIEPRP